MMREATIQMFRLESRKEQNMFFIGLAVGLIVGWNVLPQPKFMVDLVEKVKAKFSKTTPTV